MILFKRRKDDYVIVLSSYYHENTSMYLYNHYIVSSETTFKMKFNEVDISFNAFVKKLVSPFANG